MILHVETKQLQQQKNYPFVYLIFYHLMSTVYYDGFILFFFDFFVLDFCYLKNKFK